MTKYGNTRVMRDGRWFDSKAEAALYDELMWQVRAGLWRDLKCQVHVTFSDAKILMIVDFSAVNTKTGETEYFEFKGFEAPKWRRDIKSWALAGPGPYHIYKGNAKKVRWVKTIIPNPESPQKCLWCERTG